MTLKVAHKMLLTTVYPAPMAKGLENWIIAGYPTAIGGEFFKMATDLSLKEEGCALVYAKAVAIVVV